MDRVLKIAITGVESTGKTTLAKDLSKFFGVPMVGEYARTYLDALTRPYRQDDLIEIALGQIKSEKKALYSGERLVICDTDLSVIKIWSLFKYGSVDPYLLQLYARHVADLYLLTDIDVPFEEDPLRENPGERALLFEMYQSELRQSEKPFSIISGNQSQRLEEAIKKVSALLEI